MNRELHIMKRLSLGLCLILAANSLCIAQTTFSLNIPDSTIKYLLGDFKTEFGSLMYQQIISDKLPVFVDIGMEKKLSKAEVTDSFQSVISMVDFDPETFMEFERYDTVQLHGAYWDSIKWSGNRVSIYPFPSKVYYLNSKDVIAAADANPWVKKVLHVLLLREKPFELHEQAIYLLSVQLADSLHTQLNRAVKQNRISSYQDFKTEQAYGHLEVDSLFTMKDIVLVSDEDGELIETEYEMSISSVDQTGFVAYGSTSGDIKQFNIRLSSIGPVFVNWAYGNDFYMPQYYVSVDGLDQVWNKGELLLFELMIQQRLNQQGY